MKQFASMYKETGRFALLLARNDYVLRRHSPARKTSPPLKTAVAIVYQVSTAIVASGPRLLHCRSRSVLRRSRLQFPCIEATHCKAEECSRCMQSVARSGDARISCVRASPLFASQEAVCRRLCVARVNVLRKLVYKDECLSLCASSGTGMIDTRLVVQLQNVCDQLQGVPSCPRSLMKGRLGETTGMCQHASQSPTEFHPRHTLSAYMSTYTSVERLIEDCYITAFQNFRRIWECG